MYAVENWMNGTLTEVSSLLGLESFQHYLWKQYLYLFSQFPNDSVAVSVWTLVVGRLNLAHIVSNSCWVTLSKLLDLSNAQFLHCQMRIIIFKLQGCYNGQVKQGF